MTTKTIETYLQDHHAGSAAGLDAFRRVAEGHGDREVRSKVGRLAYDVAEDQRSLETIMSAFDIKPSQLKDIPARAAEKIGRLKLNERVTKRSPLSDVVELEALTAAVYAKSLGWRILLEVNDDRLDKSKIEELLNRAREQENELEELRLKQAPKLNQS
ncbi:hypothetical protein RF638_11505 [Kocuria sp. CPCC 205235]|uniref:hypothetical protein n=1 Tax=Kocuria sp. CPCC 205235 TaxID=3073549 RepID=UPI0034D47A5E